MKNKLDFTITLNCAFRYGLGRRTYVVSSICNTLYEFRNYLSNHNKQRIINEIEEAQKENNLGHSCDRVNWLWLKDKFEEDLNDEI